MEPGSTEHTQLQKIRSTLLSEFMRAPLGKKITKMAFTWTAGGNVETLKCYDGSTLLFTLTFDWNEDGTLKEVARSDA